MQTEYTIQEIGERTLRILARMSLTDQEDSPPLRNCSLLFDGSVLSGTRCDDYFRMETNGQVFLDKCSWWPYHKRFPLIEKLKEFFLVNRLGYHDVTLSSKEQNQNIVCGVVQEPGRWIITPYMGEEATEIPRQISGDLLIQFQDLIVFKLIVGVSSNNWGGFFLFKGQVYSKFNKLAKETTSPPDTLLKYLLDTEINLVLLGLLRGVEPITFIQRLETWFKKEAPQHIQLLGGIKRNILERI